ncbi:MAG: hypothetical protein AAGK10_19515 [Cyanobacteria bacterium J06555_3]
MSINCLNKPKFQLLQTVRFIGGTGTIESVQQQDNRWAYTIKMSMGAKPDFGRVGAETTIIMEEQDLRLVDDNLN